MSRARSKQKTADGPPPSHPQESFLEHRSFLIRSLERNDVDLAALVELNRSLKAAKASILESCGESVLLDLGIGRLTLVNDELHEGTKTKSDPESTAQDQHPQHHLTPVQKAMCVDFLLRMKLRRKLCNRLARRLNRVAHAMDGEDVAPPPPPRYGDLRLNIDPAAVKVKEEHWKRMEEAKKAIEEAKAEEAKQMKIARDTEQMKKEQDNKKTQTEGAAGAIKTENSTDDSQFVTDDENEKDKEKEPKQEAVPMDVDGSAQEATQAPEPITSTSKVESIVHPDKAASLAPHYEILKEHDACYEKVWDPATKRFKYIIADEVVEPEYTQIKQGNGIGGAARVMSVQEREAEHKRWQTAILSRIPEQPTFEELGLKNRVFCYQARKKRCLELEEEETIQETAQDEKEAKKMKTDDDNDSINDDEDDEAEEKDKPSEDDEKASDEKAEKEPAEGDESKPKPVPDSDTSDGDANKKDVDNEAQQDDKEKPEQETKSKTSDDEGDDSSDMFGDNSSKEEKDDPTKTSDDESSDMFEVDDDEGDNGKNGNEKAESDAPKATQPPKTETTEPPKTEAASKNANAGEKKEEAEEEKKPIKPMSLVAVPSFHDQDMTRIRMIHRDLLGASLVEHTRKRLAEATRDYNNAFRHSNELFEQRHRMQQHLNFFIAKCQNDRAKANNDYAREFTLAKQRWIKHKHDYDVKRAQSTMPSNWGHKPFGTSLLQSYIQRGQDVRPMVAACLADIVDGAMMVAEGKVPSKKFGDFVPPPDPTTNKQTGETLVQQQRAAETQYRRQLEAVVAKFNSSEEERKRLWKKMMKAKTELDQPQQQYAGRRARVDYTQTPVPPLRNSTQQSMPRENDYARISLATYTPPRSTVLPQDVGGSDSKYSAARVRERIGNDGTVAPVSEPKKTKEGLYQRPAGRTRKGMQWDPVRGIWVPEGSQ